MSDTGDIRIDEIMPSLNCNWPIVAFEDSLIEGRPKYRKLKAKEISVSGQIPVIDQGEAFIAGYTDDAANIFKGPLPVIIFGDHTRRFKFVDFEFAIGADGTRPLYPRQELDPKFFYHYLTALNLESQGYSRHYKFLKEASVPIPRIGEQHRIVAKLEALLLKVDGSKKRLERIPVLLRRFRQSVLAAACSGRLTEDWREENPAEETRPVLNDREPGLPEIPDTWHWIKLPETGEMNRGRSRHRPRNFPPLFDGPYPFIQTGDIAQSGGRIVSHKQCYSELGLHQSRLWPAGSICITIAANIAESAILTYPACFPDSVVGIIADPTVSIPEYVEFFMRVAKADLSTFAPATAQKNINIAILNQLSVPLPPLQEQIEIVKRVEALFKLADEIQIRYEKGKKFVDKLTQSILAKAFRGELVPQDPNDTPAEEMLERIGKGKTE